MTPHQKKLMEELVSKLESSYPIDHVSIHLGFREGYTAATERANKILVEALKETRDHSSNEVDVAYAKQAITEWEDE